MLDKGDVGGVAGDGEAVGAEGGGGFCGKGFIVVVENDARSTGDKLLTDGIPDTLSCAGDDGDLFLPGSCHMLGFLFEINFIIVLLQRIVIPFFDQLPVSVNIDMKVLIQLDHAFEYPGLFLYRLGGDLKLV